MRAARGHGGSLRTTTTGSRADLQACEHATSASRARPADARRHAHTDTASRDSLAAQPRPSDRSPPHTHPRLSMSVSAAAARFPGADGLDLANAMAAMADYSAKPRIGEQGRWRHIARPPCAAHVDALSRLARIRASRLGRASTWRCLASLRLFLRRLPHHRWCEWAARDSGQCQGALWLRRVCV